MDPDSLNHKQLKKLAEKSFKKRKSNLLAKAMGDRLFSEKWGEIFRNYFKLRGC